MPNDLAQAPYSTAHKARGKKAQPLPESDKKTLTPDYLLGHQQHFDPNTYTPEDLIKQNENLGGKKAPVQT